MKSNRTIYVTKTKALISCAVTAQLICVFVFAYAKSRFSHNEAYRDLQVSQHVDFVLSWPLIHHGSCRDCRDLLVIIEGCYAKWTTITSEHGNEIAAL